MVFASKVWFLKSPDDPNTIDHLKSKRVGISVNGLSLTVCVVLKVGDGLCVVAHNLDLLVCSEIRKLNSFYARIY